MEFDPQIHHRRSIRMRGFDHPRQSISASNPTSRLCQK